jgi:ketosteroid isomerase-like protein
MKKISACLLTGAICFGGAVLLVGPKAAAIDQSPALTSPTTEENSLGQQILAKERAELDALKAGDFTTFGNLIADEAVFVDALGTASKAEVLKHTEGFKLTDYKIEDVKFLPISADTGMISYYVTEKGASHGKEFTAHVYVSALWTKRANDWVCLFSQETAAK